MGEKHFVLVHGACLGAWSWYKVVTLLQSKGHKAKAIDCAACGINPKRVEEVHSVSEYVQPLMEYMAALPPEERVILVGHSMGGICISLAMEKFPKKISVAVFLSAVMPCPDVNMDIINEKYKRPMDFYMDCKFEFANGKDKPPTSFLFGPEYLSTKIFQLCPPEDVALALLLIRSTPSSVGYKSSVAGVTKENYGSVPHVYFKPENDNLINEGIERFRLENYPPEELKIIHNSDHMAMLSNPQELFACLQDISYKYN